MGQWTGADSEGGLGLAKGRCLPPSDPGSLPQPHVEAGEQNPKQIRGTGAVSSQ